MSKHPMQPVEWDGRGVIRFKQNAIVRYLIDMARARGLADMNDLALMPFSDEDRQQFAQLIGYSISGYGDLPYASRESIDEADRLAEEVAQKNPKGGTGGGG